MTQLTMSLPQREKDGAFYVTTPLTPLQKQAARKQAGRQERTVLAVIEKLGGRASPSQVMAHYPNEQTPLTSLRRAITSLTEQGRLVKTGELHEGAYGKPEHVWRLAEL